jgi:trimeric autotransporter adhesin
MKTVLLSLLALVVFTNESSAQCTINSTTNSSTLVCGSAPLAGCNGLLTIGNGSNSISLIMNATLDLTCLGAITLIVDKATLDFSPGNARLYLAEGSSFLFYNGGDLVGGSCNASERIYIGSNLFASCNGAGADVDFTTIVTLGGTGKLSSNSPVCTGNTINLLATPPPNGGPYTFSFFGNGFPGGGTAYNSDPIRTVTAPGSPGTYVYQVKMKSSLPGNPIMIAEITVTVSNGGATIAPVTSVTHPTCATPSGSITISSPTGSGMRYSINGITYTNASGVFSVLAPGAYSVTAKNASGCISPVTSTTVNPLVPITATPTLNLVTQPTCITSEGSFVISNFNSSFSYTITPSFGTTRSGNTVTAQTGSYSITAQESGKCISPPSTAVAINPQPATPQQPVLGASSHPTCNNSNGSFEITNFDGSFNYTISPSTGVSRSANMVTAPAGNYTVMASLGSCTSESSNSMVINPQRVNIWNGVSWSQGTSPSAEDRVIFNGDYSSSSNVIGCSVQINSGTVVFNDGDTLTVTNEVRVSSGTLLFENNASLVQINNTIANTGDIIYKRTTTPLKQWDFTYWSSPVANAALSQLATNYDFYSFSPTINNWVFRAANTIMSPGVGYIGRNGNSMAPAGLTTSFSGVPNNGNIYAPIIKATGTLNLIGSPYPSAINIDNFLTDPENVNIVNGTIFLWTHNTGISGNAYTQDDYAKYNLSGGVSAVSGGPVPNGKVAAGQGFFIEAHPSLANGSYNAVFKNTMRIAGNNSQFFRNSNLDKSTSSYSVNLERNRLWLSLTNSQGAYNQMLVGYIQDATDGFDTLFDGRTMAVGNAVSIYTKIGTDDYAIQGKALPFSVYDVVPVGYSTVLTGQLNINLENFDGLFENQEVYLLDKYLNLYHNIKKAPYSFYTTNGTFNDRFEIRYIANALGVSESGIVSNNIKVLSNNGELTVLSSNENISKVEIFNLLGKLIYSNKNNSTWNVFNSGKLNISSQVLLVKVTLSNGLVVSKKAMY